MLNDIFSKIDKANFKPKRLILVHGAKHPKTGKPKTLFSFSEPEKINSVPKEILDAARLVQAPKFDSSVSIVPTKCPFIDYACTHALQEGTERNLHLVPNLVTLIKDHQVWQHCADIQGKSISEFENWAKRNPKFNCAQLRKYAASIGKESICTAHLLEAWQ